MDTSHIKCPKIPKTKICYKCKEKKRYEDFRENPIKDDGLHYNCKECEKNHRNDSKEFVSMSKTSEYRKNATIRNRINNFKAWILYGTRHSAKRRNLEFNLTIEDIIIPEYCPYLNVKLTRNVGKGKTPTNPSIDRIDNSKGYIKGNVMIVSDLANRLKGRATSEELITFAQNILKIHA